MVGSRRLEEKSRRLQELNQNDQDDYAEGGGLLECQTKVTEALQVDGRPAKEARWAVRVEERQCY